LVERVGPQVSLCPPGLNSRISNTVNSSIFGSGFNKFEHPSPSDGDVRLHRRNSRFSLAVRTGCSQSVVMPTYTWIKLLALCFRGDALHSCPQRSGPRTGSGRSTVVKSTSVFACFEPLGGSCSCLKNQISCEKTDRPPLTGSQRPSHARSLHVCVRENRNRSSLHTLRLLAGP